MANSETPHQEITRRWDEVYALLDNAGQSSTRHIAEALDEAREEAEENQVEGDELRHLLASEAAEIQAWAKTARLRLLGVEVSREINQVVALALLDTCKALLADFRNQGRGVKLPDLDAKAADAIKRAEAI